MPWSWQPPLHFLPYHFHQASFFEKIALSEASALSSHRPYFSLPVISRGLKSHPSQYSWG